MENEVIITDQEMMDALEDTTTQEYKEQPQQIITLDWPLSSAYTTVSKELFLSSSPSSSLSWQTALDP